MNKRKIEGIIWFVVGFILVLLMANKSSMLSDNVGENIFALILIFWKNDMVYSDRFNDIWNNNIFL